MSKILVLVLAAGKGTRMKSELPKVLHELAGKPLVQHVIDTCQGLEVYKTAIIVGHKGELIESKLGSAYEYVWQKEQLGTGHAVMQARANIEDNSVEQLLLICGDTPLISKDTLAQMLKEHESEDRAATILTAKFADPTGYGRIIRSNNEVEKIVEQKDASALELAVQEINSGTYIFKAEPLRMALPKLRADNAQHEYYLTDVIGIFKEQGLKVGAFLTEDQEEIMGINSRVHLAKAEEIYRHKINEKFMENGVTIIDPQNTYIDADVTIGKDTVIYPFSFLKGKSVLGSGCQIGPFSTLENVKIGDQVIVKQSTIVDSTIGDACLIGPYSYIRPGTELMGNNKVGDFVELKKSIVGRGTKIPHLSYIGDSHIGQNVNIGAGTITCNYDGVNKFQTQIEDGVFVGSNSNLVAPVTISENAFIAAGSTITKDVPGKALGIARGKQINIDNWVKK